ncbi:unnamed protein product [Closterium sp. NIES-65]|nr:unnamed protein product [Closterium sp. NIES-65]
MPFAGYPVSPTPLHVSRFPVGHIGAEVVRPAGTPIVPGPGEAEPCDPVCGRFLSPVAALAPLLVPREVPPVAPGRSALSAPRVPVECLERWPMDFLGALGRDCTAESDLAPRPLPPARPAASVPVAPPASADQIRRRFEDQRRELAPRVGRFLSPRKPPCAGFVLRSGAEAVAHQERSPRRRSSAACNDKQESRRDDRHGAFRVAAACGDGLRRCWWRAAVGSVCSAASSSCSA